MIKTCATSLDILLSIFQWIIIKINLLLYIFRFFILKTIIKQSVCFYNVLRIYCRTMVIFKFCYYHA